MPVGILKSTGGICKASPVNWAHPLNRGLVSWWLNLPGRRDAAYTWRDLCKRNHGTLTNGPTWQGARGRPGGWGSLDFDGADDAASAAVNLSAFNKVTLAFWLYWDAFADNDDLAFELSAAAGGNAGAFIVDPNESSTSQFVFGPTDASMNRTLGRFARPTGAAWHHYVLLMDMSTAPGTVSAWVDGVPQSIAWLVQNTGVSTFANDTLYIMSRATTNLFGAGKLDDVRLYGGRLLGSDGAATLYTESRHGYPGLLNRVRRVTWFVPAGGGATVEAAWDEALGLSDTYLADIIKHADLAESVGLSDTFAARADLQAALTEGIGFGDSWSGRADVLAALAEGIALDDAFAGHIVKHADSVEAVGLSDTFAARADLLAALTEGIGLDDTWQGATGGTVLAAWTENVGLDDTYAARLDTAAALTESAGLDDAWTERADLTAALIEAAGFGEAFAGRMNVFASWAEATGLGDVFAFDVGATLSQHQVSIVQPRSRSAAVGSRLRTAAVQGRLRIGVVT